MKRITVPLVILIIAFKSLMAMQLADPVKWKYDYHYIDANTIELQFTATIDNAYHMYGTTFADGGPVRTSFNFEKSPDFAIKGKIKEVTKPKEKHDSSFDMLITLHSKKAVFSQLIKASKNKDFVVKGYVEYMACTDESCLPPVQKEFTFSIKKQDENASTQEPSKIEVRKDSVVVTIDSSVAKIDTPQKAEIKPDVSSTNDNTGLLAFFILAFFAGLAGTLTPCVFPMIPMTVSFFMRGSENRSKAILRGILFGISIMITYTLIGALVSLTSVGADFANQLSTHWIPNSLFFLLFLVFAASFLGMFEIVLPSNWVNKTDQQADKEGFVGIMFMALATVLISFSCTGPIVGALLVQAAGGLVLKPILGMFGFGLAFALPFTFFAIFPSAMKSLPKSGGWLNAVKVVLAFIMLAFGLKFLVNIDQAYHLNWISREVFLAIWITLSVMLGIYMLGIIRFSHDSELKAVSIPRFLISMVLFVFAIYLATGLGNNPLNAINEMLPPSEKRITGMTVEAKKESTLCETPRFAEFLHFSSDLEGYFDYKQALACAQKLNKPVLIDFKGHTCTNCKKMDAAVWSDEKVQKMIRENFVLVGLYTDDRTELPKNEWVTSSFDGKTKKTMGQINADFQITKFQNNALPLYAIVDTQGNILVNPIGTELNVDNYLAFLNAGLQAFLKK